MDIIVHEIEPGAFIRWPSGHPIMVTMTTEEMVIRRGGEIVATSERACEPYEVEENVPTGMGAAIWKNHTDAELAARKLYRATPFALPEGKRIAGAERFERDGAGRVTQVYDVEDIPPPPPEPTVADKVAALAAMVGLTVEELRQALIGDEAKA